MEKIVDKSMIKDGDTKLLYITTGVYTFDVLFMICIDCTHYN